jgi:CelD/BcsL family acetyltransferase involved in cellulose biosynthesis
MAVAAERGWLRVYILYLEERPAAFWRCTVYGGCLQGDHAGYDPVWRELSPGIFLFLNILEGFREDDIKSIDFGYGNTQFKRCLGDLRCVESQLRIYAPTLRGILLNLLNTATPCATDWARFLLQRTRCLEWARRASRNRLAHQHRNKCPIIGNSGSCNDARAGQAGGQA